MQEIIYCGIQNPSSADKESIIRYLEFRIHSMESRIWLSYLERLFIYLFILFIQCWQEVKRRFPDGLPLLDPIEDMGIKDDGLKTVIRVCISPIAFEPGWLPQSSLIAGVWISCVCVCVCGEWKGFVMFCNNSDRLSLNCQPICDNLESSYLRK